MTPDLADDLLEIEDKLTSIEVYAQVHLHDDIADGVRAIRSAATFVLEMVVALEEIALQGGPAGARAITALSHYRSKGNADV